MSQGDDATDQARREIRHARPMRAEIAGGRWPPADRANLVALAGEEVALQARDLAPQGFELGVCGLGFLDERVVGCARALRLRRELGVRCTVTLGGLAPALDQHLLLLPPGCDVCHVRRACAAGAPRRASPPAVPPPPCGRAASSAPCRKSSRSRARPGAARWHGAGALRWW